MPLSSEPVPKWSRHPAPPPPRRWWPLVLLLVLLLVVILGVSYRRSKPPASPPLVISPQPQAVTEDGHYVTLFFATDDGLGLGGEVRQLPACLDEITCVQDLVQAFLAGPGADSGLIRLFPPRSLAHGVRVEGATAVVDLSAETVGRIAGGAMTEVLCLAGLVDTLAVNFPQIRQVAILVDGMPASTLKGHVDLRQPFPVDFSLVRNSSPAEDKMESGSSHE